MNKEILQHIEVELENFDGFETSLESAIDYGLELISALKDAWNEIDQLHNILDEVEGELEEIRAELRQVELQEPGYYGYSKDERKYG